MTGRRGRRPRLAPPAPLPVPRGLCCERVELGGEEYLVLDFPAAAEGGAQERGPWSFTGAERAVAVAAAAGQSNQEIAAARRVSTRTVANQLASVYRKLGINSRAELAACWHGKLAAGE